MKVDPEGQILVGKYLLNQVWIYGMVNLTTKRTKGGEKDCLGQSGGGGGGGDL